MQIAVFTDSHALYEPTKAVLNDIKKRGITNIYSLGDNIVIGPNPYETLGIIIDNNVTSILGNSEEYIKLGIDPFKSYFNYLKEQGVYWTKEKLSKNQIDYINTSRHSIDLIAGKKIALCHFPNDVRCDFIKNSTWTFQYNHNLNNKGYEQFYYTNSINQKRLFNDILLTNSTTTQNSGYYSAINDPLFNGKTVNNYDYILMGHTHFEIKENDDKTLYHCLKGICLINKNCVSYYIITIDDTVKIEEIVVEYDRDKTINSIIKSTNPDQTVKKYLK